MSKNIYTVKVPEHKGNLSSADGRPLMAALHKLLYGLLKKPAYTFHVDDDACIFTGDAVIFPLSYYDRDTNDDIPRRFVATLQLEEVEDN